MYRYETHLHTSEGSACGSSSGAEYPALFKERGYDGIFITDHFYHGNSAPDRDLPWPEYVEQYMRGYEAAKKVGDEIGFKVFFGIEEAFEGDEYLIYGLDKEFLTAHPEMRDWTREYMIDLVHGAGGVVMQAHPFRDVFYIPKIHLLMDGVDGIEGINTSNTANDNLAALCYARRYGLKVTAGSDTHNVSSVNDGNGGIITERPVDSVQDLVNIIKNGEPLRIFYPEELFAGAGEINVKLPSEIRRNGSWEDLAPEELAEWFCASPETGAELVKSILKELGAV